MRWTPGGSNKDVIDQRGRKAPVAAGGGIIGVIVTLVIVLAGGDPQTAQQIGAALQGSGAQPAASAADAIPASQDPEKDLKDFSAYVFGNAQDFWTKTFADAGQDYTNAKLVLYRDGVSTGGCGNATSAVGPFYCPGDRRVYLDLGFYKAMRKELNAPGDFAWAYVIAHEMGHHVQEQTGGGNAQSNAESVKVELQADCYAGVWAHSVFRAGDLEDGDIDEAFTAASAVGDDTLQKAAGQEVRPDSFTHGSSAQRRQWFDTGYESGDPAACDTADA